MQADPDYATIYYVDPQLQIYSTVYSLCKKVSDEPIY